MVVSDSIQFAGLHVLFEYNIHNIQLIHAVRGILLVADNYYSILSSILLHSIPSILYLLWS